VANYITRGGNAGRPDPFRPGPHKARTRPAQRGLARPAPHTLCGLKTLARPAYFLARGPAHFFFF